ncbi:cyclic AMP-dependent transcription factor ATF-3 isoform X3 [Scyliorhinus canicula]|uniref:cyclic AMP-dependent transcription factor ATF-3 isoform X3 n=1 Tax=Scyliorhinus canicula TaxID=7830 RepID=UPI0018F5DF13|nr:cyclic AMP-dependent transcription factor ATF-3 isoform X3 [Scyliorhinus canicula]
MLKPWCNYTGKALTAERKKRLPFIRHLLWANTMMLQHIGQASASDVSTAAVVPCISPSMSLVFDEFTNITPLVKEELRFAIQSKRISNGISTMEYLIGTESSNESIEKKESEKLESLNAELKAQIEELKNEKQQLIYMLNLHRPTCIVRAQNGTTPEEEKNLFIQQIKEGTLQN